MRSQASLSPRNWAMTTTSTMIFLKLGAIFGKTRHWLGVRMKVREFINELSVSDDAVDWKNF